MCVNVVDTMFLLIVIWCCNREMNGRNDRAIVDALAILAQVLQVQSNPQVEGDESRELDVFMRYKPPNFKGRHDPEGSHVWL